MSFALLSALLQGIGYLSVVFVLTMYLQGVRGLSPLYASLLLVPGYLVSSLFAPAMGKLSDKVGARYLATGGVLLMIVGVGAYSLFTTTTPLFLIVPVSLVTGIGGGMYWPANNSAIMALARRGSYGAISGLRSTLNGVGSLLSFVIAIAVAALTVPRYVAFEVFLGTAHLRGGLASDFLVGIHNALFASAVILGVAAVVSYARASGMPSLPKPRSDLDAERSQR